MVSGLDGLIPVPVDGVTCPDCAAVGEPDKMLHEESCPFWRGVQDAVDEDRDWFAARPHAPHRVRVMTRAEVAHLHLLGIAPNTDPAGWRVIVHPIADGFRAREFLAPGASRSGYIRRTVAELRGEQR